MGNCASRGHAEGKARSDMIDRQIEEDAKKYKRECKILLLGASTSTVLLSKQCKEKI
jgi:guanine nucleotide-binding protein subunit alpha